MKNQVNSINQNGCSVCGKGEEIYTSFRLEYRPNQLFYQYDYRSNDGDLFSCVSPTLAQCREKRDKWVQAKNYGRLHSNTLKRIQENKRLAKFDMACEIGNIEPLHVMSVSWDYFSREEIVSTFNQIFGTQIE